MFPLYKLFICSVISFRRLRFVSVARVSSSFDINLILSAKSFRIYELTPLKVICCSRLIVRSKFSIVQKLRGSSGPSAFLPDPVPVNIICLSFYQHPINATLIICQTGRFLCRRYQCNFFEHPDIFFNLDNPFLITRCLVAVFY